MMSNTACRGRQPKTANGLRSSVAAPPRSPWPATLLRSAILHGVRFRPQGGRHDANANSEFRLPDSVIDEETDYISISHRVQGRQRIDSLKKLLGEKFDAIFVGFRAPRGAASLRFPAARKQRATFTSASTGSPRSRSSIPARSASA